MSEQFNLIRESGDISGFRLRVLCWVFSCGPWKWAIRLSSTGEWLSPRLAGAIRCRIVPHPSSAAPSPCAGQSHLVNRHRLTLGLWRRGCRSFRWTRRRRATRPSAWAKASIARSVMPSIWAVKTARGLFCRFGALRRAGATSSQRSSRRSPRYHRRMKICSLSLLLSAQFGWLAFSSLVRRHGFMENVSRRVSALFRLIQSTD